MVLVLVVAVVGALAFANGSNDVSKGVAPLVGSGLAGYRSAIAWGSAWTAAGTMLGAVFAGAMLTTFGHGLLAPGVTPDLGAAMAALLAAATWVALASRTGLPVSTTHALVGAVVGATVSSHGLDAVAWSALAGKVALPLVLSPLVAFLLAAALVRLLPGRGSGSQEARDCLCADMSPAVAVVARQGQSAYLASQPLLRFTTGTSDGCASAPEGTLRLTVDHLQWVTSAATSLARGMNDAPKMVALGLAAAALASTGSAPTPLLYAAVAGGMVVGGLAAGRRVTHLLAEQVTPLDGSTGLIANGVAAVLVATGAVYGLPMSTTHVASGGIAGVGAAGGSLNRTTLRQMVLAWIVTLPASAALAAAAQFVLHRVGAAG